MAELIIGVDFDNTIISYDNLFHKIAVELKLIPSTTGKSKKQVRDTLRQLPNGEVEWQRLQALVYGWRINEAELINGVDNFFRVCKEKKIKAYIISHKTQHSNLGETDYDLRKSAMQWMEQNHFFESQGLGLSAEDVYFNGTREEKIESIKKLGCTHYIDDLEETFNEKSFPDDVQKILYAPHGQSSSIPVPDIKVFHSWDAITDYFFPAESSSGLKKELKQAMEKKLKKKILSAELIGQGRNSRIYKINCNDNKEFAVKLYFVHEKDKRDRLKVEFSALKFMWEHNIRSIPEPILADAKNHYAIYEYIDGSKISSEQITAQDINAAASFLKKLDELKSRKESKSLPIASDACSSPSEAVNGIEKRLKRLVSTPKNTPQYKELHIFLDKEFIPGFNEIVKWCKAYCKESAKQGLSFEKPIAASEKTLSPSDFGFHNSLRRNNEVVFLDMEYFGWDDPAKLMADFLLHPATELKDELKKRFVKDMLAHFKKQKQDKQVGQRLKAIHPLHALKWCLIILNEFVPEYLLRRKFASNHKINITLLRTEQLAKAKRLLYKTINNYKNFSYAD